MRSFVFHVVLVVLVLQPPLSYAVAVKATTYAEGLERIDQTIELLSAVQTHIDRSQFDVDALLETLGYETQAIIDFVQEQMGFQAYVGLLRGAQGTLQSRAGNALDQAVLLATLLKQAGYDARIAEAELDDALAQQLVRQIEPSTSYVSPWSDFPVATLEKIARALNKPKSEIDQMLATEHKWLNFAETPYVKDTEDAARSLLAQLSGAGISIRSQIIEPEPIAESRTYYWVDFRGEAAGQWRRLHPANRQEPRLDREFHEICARNRNSPRTGSRRPQFQRNWYCDVSTQWRFIYVS